MAIAICNRVFSLLLFCALVLPGSQLKGKLPSGQDDVTQHFRSAQEDMQAGRFDAAIEQFKQVLRLDPGLVEARVNLGLAYHATGDYRLAVAELGQASKQSPDLLPASLFLGLCYLKLGSPRQAIPPLDHALALDASNREARRALATAELSEGDYAQAERHFRYLFAAADGKADGWFILGRDYLQMAKQLSTQFTAQFPNSAWSLRLAGDVLAERSLWNDAAHSYSKAVSADPVQLGLHAALGDALLSAGKSQEAVPEFDQEISRHPFDTVALLGLAELSLLNGDPQSALQHLRRIWQTAPEVLGQDADFPDVEPSAVKARQMAADIEKVPIDPAREFLRFALYRVGGDPVRSDQARQSFEKSLTSAMTVEQVQNEDSDPRTTCEQNKERACAALLASQKHRAAPDNLRLGRALFALRQNEAASDVFAAALQQNQTAVEAAYWLTRSYLRLADTCFDELAAAYPDSWRAHELKGEAFGIRQADKEAIAEFRLAARLHPDDPEIHEALGDFLLRQNEPDDAKSELETALQLNPSAPRSLFLLGSLYVNKREPAKAIPYLEAALRYDPSLTEARPVLGKAYLKVGKLDRAIAQLEQSSPIDRYGDLHYLLYEAYRDDGKPELAAQALARSQELRSKSAADDQSKIKPLGEE